MTKMMRLTGMTGVTAMTRVTGITIINGMASMTGITRRGSKFATSWSHM